MNTIQSLQASDVAKRQSLNNHPSTWLLLLRRILALGLVAVPLAALPTSLSAGELKDQAQEKKAPSTLTGRIISVDKSLRSLAVEIKGTILRVNVTSLVRISKKGKLAGLEDLAPGQEVVLSFRETVQGRLEVVSLTIQGSSAEFETAGGTKKTTTTH